MKCLSFHSADIAQDTDGIRHSSAQNKYRAKKIWSKIDPGIENVRTSSSFMHAIRKNILLHL